MALFPHATATPPALILLATLLATVPAPAALDVQPARTLSHQVLVQPIRVRKTNGTEAAFLGSASSEAYIKDQIDRAWAQVGIDITWLPVTSYTNDFAYDGSPGNYTTTTRPQSHLGQLIDAAPAPPKSTTATVLNLFFVGIVPGFKQTSDNTSNGLAFVDDNGVAVHVGPNLLTWEAGRDVVAGVIAHEIGHNLGLSHYLTSNDNLMFSGANSAEYLVPVQESIVFTGSPSFDGYDLLQPLSSVSKFDLWAASYSLDGNPGDDSDGDGLSDGFEFLFGSPPNVPNPFPAPTLTAAGPVWTLAKQADAVADGFDYRVLCGPRLDTWLPAGSHGSRSSVLQDNATATVVRLENGHDRAFLKVDVVTPPAAGMARVLPPDPPAAERVLSGCGDHGCGHRTLVRE